MNKTEISKTNKTIGRAIAKCRKAANLSQEEVAEKLKIGNESVSRMERGIVMPTVERLLELAEIFSCPVSEFLSQISHRSTDRVIYLDMGSKTKVKALIKNKFYNLKENNNES